MRLDDSDRRALKRMLREERERGAYTLEGAVRADARDRARERRRRLCSKAERMRRCAGCSYEEIARALLVSRYEAKKMCAEAHGEEG